MKPYFQDKDVTIYHGDCRDILPSLPKVDLMLTDPPYGINFVENSNRMQVLGYSGIQGDNETIDLTFLLRYSDNQIIFGGNYFNLPISSGWIIWDKQDGKQIDFGDAELIWTSFNEPIRIIKHIWDGFRRDSDRDIKREHPSQKPVGLISTLLLKREFNVVLDPFMGSGTTLRAAKNLGRKAIGIEIEEKYCEIAAKRMAQTVMDFEALK
jgi:site-specific DNA-methyltransferase (adenine-specific)